MISITRRAFLSALSLALLVQHPLRLLAGQAPRDWQATLSAFLDTLMPADETPSATSLRVDAALLEMAQTDTRYRRLLRYGCLWLDRTAQREHESAFAVLTERQRTLIVERLEQQAPDSIAGAFFRHVRSDLFEFYYSHPLSRAGLGMDRPPQPQGYPGYHEPPGMTS